MCFTRILSDTFLKAKYCSTNKLKTFISSLFKEFLAMLTSVFLIETVFFCRKTAFLIAEAWHLLCDTPIRRRFVR